jgi:carboxyl-terminal processing protease
VRAAFMIDKDTGYVKLTEFTETSNRELGDARQQLTPKGMKRLVFDLRDNPGGALSQAIQISNRFLPKGNMIVYTRGRVPNANEEYRATEQSDYTHLPIVALVNRNSASASEIVSGALQDHDRALVVGETTFGKGLVQTVYPLSDNTGLALTTYHYYTPSGRLIQRNYNGVSLYDYYYNHDQPPPADDKNREVKLTDSGRTVYGGGGITPDDKIATPKSNHFQDVLLEHYIFFNFASHYLANRTVDKNFQVDDAVMNEFRQFLNSQQISFTEQDLNGISDWLKANIKADIFTTQFGQEQGLRVRADWDPMISQAISYLPQAQALEDQAKKADEQRASAALHTDQ